MSCIDQPIGCITDGAGNVVGGVVDSVAGSAWNAVCQSFADAATTLLSGFAKAFVAFPSINPASEGIGGVYAISLGIAAVVASGLFLLQIARTVLTHDGQGLAHGIVGLGKAALAFMATLTITAAAIEASNELTAWIVSRTFQDPQGLEKKLATVFVLEGPTNSGALLLVLGLVGIILTLVLWFELLLSNAAVAVLIGTSPIAAAGQVSEATKSWWPKLVSATAQLIILKPVIALVFAVGFGIAGDAEANTEDVGTLLAGMLILVLAALAWPAIARFFTFASIVVGGGSGLASVIGFAAGRTNGAGAGAPAESEAQEFAQNAESRTMSAFAARSAGAGSAGSASAVAGAAGGGAAAAAMPMVAAGLALAQRAANSLSGRMEQTAGHAGLERHNPHPAVAGYPGYQPMVRQRGEHHAPAEPGTNDPDHTQPPMDPGPGNSAHPGDGGPVPGPPGPVPMGETHAPPPPDPTSGPGQPDPTSSTSAQQPGLAALAPGDPTNGSAPARTGPAGPGALDTSGMPTGRLGGSGWPGSPAAPPRTPTATVEAAGTAGAAAAPPTPADQGHSRPGPAPAGAQPPPIEPSPPPPPSSGPPAVAVTADTAPPPPPTPSPTPSNPGPSNPGPLGAGLLGARPQTSSAPTAAPVPAPVAPAVSGDELPSGSPDRIPSEIPEGER